MQQVLIDYNKQGVIGVRIYFGMNGDGFSTPFLAGNPITFDQQGWLTKLSNFLQDVQAAHIPYVSFTPAWVPWAADGNMSIYAIVSGSSGSYSINTNCTAATANAVFYPWLPWGLNYSQSSPNRDPIDLGDMQAVYKAPELPVSQGAWQWGSDGAPDQSSLLYQFFNGIFGKVAAAQLQIREFDLSTELPFYSSSLYARQIYDPLQNVHPLFVINTIMYQNGFGPTATLSTASSDPGYEGTCNSFYGDSALVINTSLMLSATTGYAFGTMRSDSSYPSPTNSLYCARTDGHGDLLYVESIPTPNVPGSPIPNLPPVLDVHAYPFDAVHDQGWGWVRNTNSSACQFYSRPGDRPKQHGPGH
jgi:hypothetical protein